MSNLPVEIIPVLLPFANIFALHKTFSKALTLMMGTLLCRGGVTVCAALRACGLASERRFSRYHRFLNRDQWNLLVGSRILLLQLIERFKLGSTLTFVIDDTLERRTGKHIRAKGWFKDPVQSGHGKIVTSPGLRWMPVMLLAPVPFIGRTFALPILTVLVPSEKRQKELGLRHRSPQRKAAQVACILRRWLPHANLRIVVDAGYASIGLFKRCKSLKITLVTRMRTNVRLFELPPPKTGQRGRPRKKGERINLQEKVASLCWSQRMVRGYQDVEEIREVADFLCLWAPSGGGDPIQVHVVVSRNPQDPADLFALLTTNEDLPIKEALELYVLRWNQEVTHREVRQHLGMETQRQWSDRAIARTTPILFALYSLTFLMAERLHARSPIQAAQAAWYDKKEKVTFSDVLRSIRGELRRHLFLQVLAADSILQKFPPGHELLDAVLGLVDAA